MKFTCERDTLTKEISIAQEIISSRNVLSVLSNVFLKVENDHLVIRATDLKVGFETQIPVEVAAEGSTTVFCDKLLGILRSLPSGEIEFELEDNMLLNIRPLFKKINFRLKSISSDKYPEILSVNQDSYFDFLQKDLIEMVAMTIFAISDDETRYFMNGVYLEKSEDTMTMVASDGRRLSLISKKVDAAIPDVRGTIIPPKILGMFRRLLPGEGKVSLCITDKNIFARFGSHSISSTLIDGQFPNYQRVIPETQEHRIVVQKELLETALKRVALLVEQKSRRIFLRLSDDLLTVASEEGEIGMASEEIPCQYSGPEDVVALNYLYLVEPLREIQEESVSIEFTDTSKAVTLRSMPEKEYLHVIMPMQTK